MTQHGTKSRIIRFRCGSRSAQNRVKHADVHMGSSKDLAPRRQAASVAAAFLACVPFKVRGMTLIGLTQISAVLTSKADFAAATRIRVRAVKCNVATVTALHIFCPSLVVWLSS